MHAWSVLSALQLRDLALVLEQTLYVSLDDVVQAFSIVGEGLYETLNVIIRNLPVTDVYEQPENRCIRWSTFMKWSSLQVSLKKL